MPSTQSNLKRPHLTLDEQSFQGLLAAAFTIQEHNDRMKKAQPTPAPSQALREPGAISVCEHCGARKPAEQSRCHNCGLEQLRPGERLQRNWASMWLMSQEQGLWPIRPSEVDDAVPPTGKGAQEELAPQDSDLAVAPLQLSESDDSFPADASDGAPISRPRFADLREKLRAHRADLYLLAAVLVTALALLWPTAGSPRRAALRPWQKALVALGIAEVPAPAVHLQGDPSVQVWVDPHTALYYCPGEEQYGKTADGRVSSQRDAQMDRFEPAGRSVCE